MEEETAQKDSQLIRSLREGVSIVQMVLFKEVRANLISKRPNLDKSQLAMLAGSITNEVFGTQNPEEKFVRFCKENWGEVEQELLNIKEDLAPLCALLTDALRIQTLCDHQEGGDSSVTLLRAKELDFLREEREIPLPSSFMSSVRELGKRHNLLVPSLQITPEQDDSMVH
ncbi:MAG: hypothetical protein GY799_33575 [Desulfobulbaceae bacterium]|nr:hypothetical protein [Desulfobulbaceae bacterium]